MTARRGKVEASLAERGRPAMWATEAEAAALCDRTYAWFWKNRRKLEAAGFPRRHPLINKRPVQAIKDFLGQGYSRGPITESEDQPKPGNWG